MNHRRSLLISDLPAQPSLLIRISREWREDLTPEQLYERVRRYWKLEPEKRKRPPVLAYGIADGIIRAVYWIEAWATYEMTNELKAPDRVDQAPHAPGKRVGFVGRPATEYHDLIGCALDDVPRGQNPVTYVR